MWSHRWRAMPPVSEVWKYVTRRDDKTIVCNMCGSQLACSGSATVLRLHLQRNHRIHFTEEPDRSNLQGADSTTEKIPCAKERTPKITELIGIDSPVTRTSQSSKRISDMLRECAARLEEGEESERHSILGVDDAHTALTEDELSMVLRSYQVAGGVRRRAELSLQRAAPVICPERERGRAQTWDFFKKLNERCVECSLCRKQLCYHNSTASLREHLRRRHQHQLGEPEARLLPDDGSSSSESLGQEAEVKRVAAAGGSEPALLGAGQREELLDLIAGMVFRDLQPLSLVTEDGFRRLLRYLQPDYRVPSAAQVSAHLRHQYSRCKARLERQLRSVPSLALSTHGWSTPARRGYLTVLAHFIDGGWNPARCVLRTGRAGAGASRELLRSALADFGLAARSVSCVVHEGAAGGERLAPGCPHLCCAGRTLQQCVRHGLQLEAVQRALAAARRLVAHLQRSGRASARLAQGGGEAPEPLLLDTASRWDTTAEMCRRLVRARRAVRAALEEERAAAEEEEEVEGEGEPPVADLTEPQWELLGDLLPVLRPLQVALSFLGERQNAAASALLPCLHGVVSALGQHPDQPGCPAGAVRARIRAEISQRWHLQEEGELLAHPAALASFFDPRFKDLRFLGTRARHQLQRRVKSLLSAGVPEPGSPAGERCPEPGSPGGERRPDPGSPAGQRRPERDHPEPGSPAGQRRPERDNPEPGSPAGQRHPERAHPQPSDYDLLFGEDPVQRLPEVDQQLDGYLAEPLRRRDTDPFLWWRDNAHRFPALAGLARRYLAVPATAVPAGRPFLGFGRLPEDGRGALGPDDMDRIIFLHKNFDYIELLK